MSPELYTQAKRVIEQAEELPEEIRAYLQVCGSFACRRFARTHALTF